MTDTLEVRSVVKSYGGLRAVDGISFEVGAGQIVGLLGPNGAGKSTTVSLVAGLLRPDAGEVRIAGRVLRGDDDALKRSVGLVPQDLALYEDLSAEANLRFFGALFGMRGKALERATTVALGRVGLETRAAQRVKTMSGGMKRRLNLAAGLLHDPDLLLLDEPTVGVDPQSRHALFETLLELKRRGKALLYATHYLEEAERLCDRIVVVDHGRVVADDTLAGLRALLPASQRLRLELVGPDGSGWLAELGRLTGVRSAHLEGAELWVDVEDLTRDTPLVVGWLGERGARCAHIASERADLESVFLSLTGRSLRDS